MLAFHVLFLLSRCPGAYSHGYLAKPSPRNVINCGDDPDPFCKNNVAAGAGFANSAAAPGETHVPEPACGAGKDDARFTAQGDIVATYTAGQTVNVEWKMNANHGGHVAYRLCLDGSNTEDCFGRQYLENEDGEVWTKVPTDVGGAYVTEAVTLKNTIRIPEGVSCDRCTLSWRWDSDYGDVAKVRVNCADISIMGKLVSEDGNTGAVGDTDDNSTDLAGDVGLLNFANRKTIMWSPMLVVMAPAVLAMTKGSRN